MRHRTILLVEDNPDDEELTRRALRSGMILNPLEVVRDGAAALDYLLAPGTDVGRDPEDLPVVVLLDLKLPKVDGLEVLRRLRAAGRTRHLPVVVLTSSTEEQDLVASYRLLANSYVRKPVNVVEFSEAVRTLGIYWALVNRLPVTPPCGS